MHLSKTIASTAEVNKNALNSGINADRTMPDMASIGLLVQIICEISASFLLNSYCFRFLLAVHGKLFCFFIVLNALVRNRCDNVDWSSLAEGLSSFLPCALNKSPDGSS